MIKWCRDLVNEVQIRNVEFRMKTNDFRFQKWEESFQFSVAVNSYRVNLNYCVLCIYVVQKKHRV